MTDNDEKTYNTYTAKPLKCKNKSMQPSNATVEKRLLKRLVKCARQAIAAPVDTSDRDGHDEFDTDNAAVEWITSLSFSPGDVHDAIAQAAPIRYLDSRGTWCIVEPEKAVRRLITIANRLGFDEVDRVKECLFKELDASVATIKPRRIPMFFYRIQLSIIGRATNGVIGTIVVEAPNQVIARHLADVELWNPRLNAGLAHHAVHRLTEEEVAQYKRSSASDTFPAEQPAQPTSHANNIRRIRQPINF